MKDFNILFPNFIKENITSTWVNPKKEAVYTPFPKCITIKTQEIFNSLGIENLYKHQTQSINKLYSGKNVAIVTGTGSGKSLCYQIPLLDSYIRNPLNTSLLLFPTKALSSDQFSKLNQLSEAVENSNEDESHTFSVGIYDGDTPKSRRKNIRDKANILLTNPDMLHLGILPHHPTWMRFFSNLKYIVIDEMHIYKGVFGSHFTNLIRRMGRILEFYGSSPQFILTSATIGNPKSLAEKIIEKKVIVVDKDFSKQNAKYYVFYNPPISNARLGLRKSMLGETFQISKLLYSENIQTLIFGRSRNSVEILLRKIINSDLNNKHAVSAYRSGFLKDERRKIEAGLRSKELKTIISTTALELGIDIGSVEVVILMGYPGSIARFFQQAGRAGREEENSICIMVASASPLDQFFIRHPEFIKEKSPEQALIDPNNSFLLFNHLKCAAFELPFKKNDHFGSIEWDHTSQYLTILEEIGMLHEKNDKYFWNSDLYPANQISLRSILGNPFILINITDEETKQIGEIDQKSAKKMIYPGAIYLHNGWIYRVQSLNFETHIAALIKTKDVYLTEPTVHVSTKIEKEILSIDLDSYKKGYGEIKIEETVIGFKKLSWDTGELLGQHDLDLESDDLITKGLWLSFSEEIINKLRILKLWTNDKNNYGSNWEIIREKVIKRDKKRCQICGSTFSHTQLHVHHIKPFRSFKSLSKANRINNLISLCKRCHRLAENNIRTKSLLNGLIYGISYIAPLFLNCDIHDLGYSYDEKIGFDSKNPGVIIYDQFPGGIGLTEDLFSKTEVLLRSLKQLVEDCSCFEGCPSCVGPPGENGVGAKQGIIELLNAIDIKIQ
jgi:DEAD/DEAH box helicase domain-containing protein